MVVMIAAALSTSNEINIHLKAFKRTHTFVSSDNLTNARLRTQYKYRDRY